MPGGTLLTNRRAIPMGEIGGGVSFLEINQGPFKLSIIHLALDESHVGLFRLMEFMSQN